MCSYFYSCGNLSPPFLKKNLFSFNLSRQIDKKKLIIFDIYMKSNNLILVGLVKV